MYKPLFEKYDYIKKYPARKCYPPNLGAVDLARAVFRGAAPNKDGTDTVRVLKCLKRKGVGKVLILNQTEQNISVEEEIEAIEKVGLEYFHIDWRTLCDKERKGDKKLWKHIKGLMDKGGLFIHCVWGADRTGSIVGRYRRERHKWSSKDIQFELSSYGWALGGTIPKGELYEYQKQVLAFCGCPLSVYQPIG